LRQAAVLTSQEQAALASALQEPVARFSGAPGPSECSHLAQQLPTAAQVHEQVPQNSQRRASQQKKSEP
jgi:hypothetical protein